MIIKNVPSRNLWREFMKPGLLCPATMLCIVLPCILVTYLQEVRMSGMDEIDSERRGMSVVPNRLAYKIDDRLKREVVGLYRAFRSLTLT